ncbi:restriction endonuclease subunit S [Acinetobacter baumannii]|nr:restriction endonuclease subunit S [Acinetobacter baumannii]MDI9692373.1 restriction endonuclease subunit S [Acinetobacter baumannii]
MSEWQQGSLDSFFTLKRGYDLPKQSRITGEIPVIASSGFSDFHNEAKVNESGVVTGRYGTIGSVFFSEKPFWPLNTTLYVNDFKGNNKRFIYYFLQTLDWEKFSDKSAVPGVNRNDVHQEQITFPQLLEQKAIASVLTSLDDKIDLLHRQNNTLEAMAETLLIQHILPKEDTQDEELHQLGDYLDTVSVTHKLSKSQVIFLNTSDIYKGKVLTTELSDVKTLPGQAKKSILKGDILFSEIRPANGRYALVDFEADNYVVSTKLMVLRAKQSKLLGLLYFYITNRHTTDWLQVLAESRSGTFPQITFDQVADLEFRLPKGQMLENLILLLDDILLKQSANNKQIQTLEQLRDTLLPKLMSGEVRVQYQTEQVA